MSFARPERREILVTGALAFLWLAALAWVRPLMLPDEGRYVGVAWEMIRSGHWLTPTLNRLPYFHKPPLFYWLTAVAVHCFGLHEWAARAAPLLGAWTGVMASFLFLRRWWHIDVARAAVVVLLCQPLLYLGGQYANLDMLVAGCITATICLLAHSAMCIEQGLPCGFPLRSAYVFAALGVLAKGLIGAVIPAMVIGLWLLSRRQWRPLLRLIDLPGALLALAVAGPWFVAMQGQFPSFLHYFFVVQHFQRFASGGFNNVQPFWFYPAVLTLSFLPWVPWLKPRWDKAWFSAHPRGALRGLLVIWAGSVLVFFSLPQSKLVGYILPAVPPLVMLLADGLETRRIPGGRGWWCSVAMSAALCIAAIVAVTVHPLKSTQVVAEALRQHRQAGEPVVMLENYFFDLPWYARLEAPAIVVDDWQDAGSRDNWRKELADAGVFAPVQAQSTLLSPAQLPQMLCHTQTAWVIGNASAMQRWPWLAQAEAITTVQNTTLWRWPGQAKAAACAGKPNAD
jgi:4-amino-4-deoxy-L-arabinose transferase-like glycosyltransferase